MLRTSGARPARFRGRWAAVAVLLFLGVWLAPTAASAHSVLLRSTPEGDVRSAPDAVSLDFNERPRARFSVIHVVGPDGQRRDAGTLTVVDDTVRQPIAGSRPAGVYTVDWRVVSADGHPVSGQWRFSAATEAAPLAAPVAVSAPTSRNDGAGGAHLGHAVLAIAVVVLLGLSYIGERLWKRRRGQT